MRRGMNSGIVFLVDYHDYGDHYLLGYIGFAVEMIGAFDVNLNMVQYLYFVVVLIVEMDWDVVSLLVDAFVELFLV